MGVTIFYRGSISDMDRVEDFENHLQDVAVNLGGEVRRWHTTCDDDPSRVVRGLIVSMHAEHESVSLLLSPEGWLVGLFEIEAAENGDVAEKPWCFVKTQFGPPEAHIAVVDLLTVVKAEFCPDLEVSDEGSYWEERDANKLAKSLGFLQRAIEGLAGAIENDNLSPEAAEDPKILATRIHRLANKVQRELGETENK